jgi:phosphoribosyl-ATP pyrophosphohydrolase
MATDDVLDRLMAQIHERVQSLPEGSYTTKLIQGGVEKIASKIREESGELIEAADKHHDLLKRPVHAASAELDDSRKHLVHEACDLIYHVWVLLGSQGVSVDDLRTELERREGTSGLEEKRQRGKRDSE